MPAKDGEMKRIFYEDNAAESYSDRCNRPNCGHSRADHLASDKGLHVLAISDCDVQLCSLPISDSHPKHGADCALIKCGCEGFY